MLDEGRRVFGSDVTGMFWIPPDVIIGRDLSVTGAQGGQFVTTQVGPLINMLRPKLVCARAGAQSWAACKGQ